MPGGRSCAPLIIDAGGRDGVVKGQAVISEAGLVGHIVEAGERASRLLLLTDLNSRVPVVVESSRARAILAGNNSDRPKLRFLADNAVPPPGERIVTSGHGGVFPSGLAVGLVAPGDLGGARVEPFADFNRIEYVRVVRYQPPRLYEDERAAAAAQAW